jgi:hypothetical protein
MAEEVINELLKLTGDFDPSVRDSSLRSLVRIKGIVPKAMREDVDKIIKSHKSD